jgi:hypothetical protein
MDLKILQRKYKQGILSEEEYEVLVQRRREAGDLADEMERSMESMGVADYEDVVRPQSFSISQLSETPPKAFDMLSFLHGPPLKGPSPPDDVCKQNREQHLSEEEFVDVFGMYREEYEGMAKWRRIQLKKAAGLF